MGLSTEWLQILSLGGNKKLSCQSNSCIVRVCLVSMTLRLLVTELTLGYWFTWDSAGWTREEQSTTPKVILYRMTEAFELIPTAERSYDTKELLWRDIRLKWWRLRVANDTLVREHVSMLLGNWKIRTRSFTDWNDDIALWMFEDTVYGCRSGTELSIDRFDWWNDSASPKSPPRTLGDVDEPGNADGTALCECSEIETVVCFTPAGEDVITEGRLCETPLSEDWEN